MFTTGKIIFASLFLVVFLVAMVWSYKKDIILNKIHYKDAAKPLFVILLVLIIMFLYVKLRHIF